MGFSCPVCAVPQQDATHLANHLAFTAMVNNDDHETWLDEHVPEWSEHGEAELAPKVAELASEADYEQVFEDTAHAHGHDGHTHQHGHRHGHQRGQSGPGAVDPEAAAAAGRGSLDEEARSILAEAREMTAEMIDTDTEAEAGAEADEESEPEPGSNTGATSGDADK
ncbi:hypothetical protein D3D02_02925 [Halobellus sp. Atlit-38R]|uniref:DUF5810 domain-containing protein n=1 Tax=Halobellus sp. Atlit-38R TaxID=2282131 RepID=UPI000EF222B1|nr:DUF5810 domain-containing protein [Halobellus sp. Atlit-38R]RLM90738.1 hypothetical protein D3D02_02925 [Halobellus sp. Atlit-38R]